MLWVYIRLGVRSEITGWTRTLERLYCLWKCVLSQKKEKKNSSPTGLYCQWRGKGNSPDSTMDFAYSGVDIYVRTSNTQGGNLWWVNTGLTSVQAIHKDKGILTGKMQYLWMVKHISKLGLKLNHILVITPSLQEIYLDC